MSYYGESGGYYGSDGRPPYNPNPGYDRPPYERPPYEEHRGSPYQRPPYEEHRGSPYERPPYEGERSGSYDSRPHYSSAPPSARPPQYPPPPLPYGWIQEWEPSARRAFFVETATGRSEWTLPADASYGEQSRGGGEPYPPPVPAAYPPHDGGYPPQYPPQEGYGGEYPEEKKKEKSDTGKYLAAGAAGLAIGAVGGAILGHELTENSDGSGSDHEEEEERHYSDDGSD